MKTVIISGGTGNDALVRGLKHYYPSMDCKVIVNAYDNGKSTGVCRAVTNTLGVSDIRKNHIRMYLAMTEVPNRSIVEFYENRYNFTPGNEISEIIEKLEKWDLTQFEVYVKHFFERDNSKNYKYTDFNVSNIVYSEMYAEEGYEYTNYYFCKEVLGIDNFVILNSFDNVFITAKTELGKSIDDEGKIVEWCNLNDKITHIFYEGNSNYVSRQLNNNAIKAIEEADLLVISTGTFWSSIFPTIDYAGMWDVINKSKAKKIWAFNCEEDKDSYGVSADNFIDFMLSTGLNVSDFTLLFNTDACKSLSDTSYDKYKKYHTSMDNTDGKHCSKKFAEAILQIYYGLDLFTPEYILCDFDDTLWPRDSKLVKFGIDNVDILNSMNKGVIISGNSYSSIVKKLSVVYGEELTGFDVPIWADASSTEFISGKSNYKIPSCFISRNKANLVAQYFKDKFNIVAVNDISNDVPFIKFKPLGETERKLVVDLFNSFLRYHLGCAELKASITGRTTVDITKAQDNKVKVFDELDVGDCDILYIGDEVDSGNDENIAQKATLSIHTSGVEETNCILRVIQNDLRTYSISR